MSPEVACSWLNVQICKPWPSAANGEISPAGLSNRTHSQIYYTPSPLLTQEERLWCMQLSCFVQLFVLQSWYNKKGLHSAVRRRTVKRGFSVECISAQNLARIRTVNKKHISCVQRIFLQKNGRTGVKYAKSMENMWGSDFDHGVGAGRHVQPGLGAFMAAWGTDAAAGSTDRWAANASPADPDARGGGTRGFSNCG